MNWLLGMVVGNAGVMWLEWCYRVGRYDNFVSAMPSIIIPVLIAQAGLFYGFRTAPSLLLAGAVFSLLNIGLRAVNVYLLGETLNWYTWTGIVLLISATVLFAID